MADDRAVLIEERTRRPLWDVRAAWITLWLARSNVVMDFGSHRRPRWWEGWSTTIRAWWLVGHGRDLWR